VEHNDAQNRLMRDATTGREKRANEGTVFAISPMPRRCALRHLPFRELDVGLTFSAAGAHAASAHPITGRGTDNAME
jgi:hypothetical protein